MPMRRLQQISWQAQIWLGTEYFHGHVQGYFFGEKMNDVKEVRGASAWGAGTYAGRRPPYAFDEAPDLPRVVHYML